MKIHIITGFPFPIGLSGTNRLISYTKGLVELGEEVEIIIVQPTEERKNVFNKLVRGSFKNIKFEYAYKNTLWPNSLLGKLYVTIISLINSIKIYYKSQSIVKSDVLITTIDSFSINLPFFILTRIFRNKFIFIVDEYPKPIRYNKAPNFFHAIMLKYWFKIFDGIVVMTNSLEDYFRKKKSSNASILIMPMTVEHDRFEYDDSESPIDCEYIAYIGSFGDNKDGVYDLIKAFSLIEFDNYHIKLMIIGDSKKMVEMNALNQYCNTLGVENKIIFTGRIPRDLVPSYLNNAKLLALARPDSTRAQGGFPTKLGEYLSTGKPVLVTTVGEIPNYLEDGKNAFLSQPGDPEEFAKKMMYILENYTEACIVGKKGQELALTTFNNKYQANRLQCYLNNITIR